MSSSDSSSSNSSYVPKKKNVPKKKYISKKTLFGLSNHPLRQKLIDRANKDGGELKVYAPKYYEGPLYFNIDLSIIKIHARNSFEACVVFKDYLNMNMISPRICDAYYDMFDEEEDFDENGNIIYPEENFMNPEHEDTMWFEISNDSEILHLHKTF